MRAGQVLKRRPCGQHDTTRMGDCCFAGISTEVDHELALNYYQKAEQLFYKRLQEGDFLIMRNYERVIARQEESRKKMKEALPDFDWTK